MVKVLVVEDEASIREMIALNLRLAGMEAVEADSAEAALPLLEQKPGCDAAILDVMLPGMNGFSEFAKEGKLVAAICAAPSVLGQAGILNGKKAACHPGFEEKLTGAEVFFSPVVCDGNVITSRGMGTAVPFGLAVARYFTDDATIEHVKAGLVYA